MQELWKRYRPKTLKDVIGQPEAVRIISEKLKSNSLPHSILLHGNSGTGKTTIARILKRELSCSGLDYQEINAASSRGIDMVREIERRVSAKPMSGSKCRIWVFDEAHQLVKKKGGDAQTALLKVLEDTPSHAYFILATTDPRDLLPTIRNRCLDVPVYPLNSEYMRNLLDSILQKEKAEVPEKVLDSIIEVAEGSARAALGYLEKVLTLENEEKQLSALQGHDSKRAAFDLVKALLYQQAKWPEIAALIKATDVGEDPERFRHLILAIANTEMLKAGKFSARAALIADIFRNPWYDCKESGLTAGCYEVWRSKE